MELTQETAKTKCFFLFFLGLWVDWVVNGDWVVLVGCVCEHEALFTVEMLFPSAHVPFLT